ncbi:MAG: hypothetical protein JW929_13945 [Anaerolineales bacterium]|nr:hypothetical protein [Anaerolineales bacterium]
MERHVVIPLKRFFLLEECPAAWKELDLYLIRDGSTVFYVGQSHLAFDRVWTHIRGGYRVRSSIGRFLLCNWPQSLNYEIEFLSSRSAEFESVNHDLLRAEALLIGRHKPCLNDSLNAEPAELPERYRPPNAEIRCSRSLTKLKFQAALAAKRDEKGGWMRE